MTLIYFWDAVQHTNTNVQCIPIIFLFSGTAHHHHTFTQSPQTSFWDSLWPNVLYWNFFFKWYIDMLNFNWLSKLSVIILLYRGRTFSGIWTKSGSLLNLIRISISHLPLLTHDISQRVGSEENPLHVRKCLFDF